MRDNNISLDTAREVVNGSTDDNIVSSIAESMVIIAYNNPDKSGEELKAEMIGRCVNQP